MARKFLTNIDMNANQILNLVLQQLGTDPVSPSSGQIWFNTSAGQVKFYNGTSTVVLYEAATGNTPSRLVLRDSSGNFAANIGTFNSITLGNSPNGASDAVNKSYVDNMVQGLAPKGTARLATTEALPANVYANGTLGVGATLTAAVNGALSVDGVAVEVGDLILVKDESATANNGLYTITVVGDGSTKYVLTRSSSFDLASEIQGGFVFIGPEGTANENTGWIVSSTGPYVIGTTSITFTQFTSVSNVSPNAPLSMAGNIISLNFTNRLANNGGDLDLATSGVSAGQYALVTVDVYGRVTSATDIVSGNGLVVKTAGGTYTNRSIANGTGISITNSDGVDGNPTVAIDTSVVARKYNTTINGDDVTTAFTVTHNLNTTAIQVQVRDSSGNRVEVDDQANAVNTCVVSFAVAPTGSTSYSVIVMG